MSESDFEIVFEAGQSNLDETFLVLGGDSTFPRMPRSKWDASEMIQAGLPFGAFSALAAHLQLKTTEYAWMGFAPRTVKNREEAGTLTYRQSDLAYRAAEVFAHAMRTFGSADKARHWLRLENRTLRDQRPLEVLGSQIGTDAVHEALSRIEHGLGA